jgi:hypothetical protein
VYDDDDADAENSGDQVAPPEYGDPMVNLRDAFTLGRSALSLFFLGEGQDEQVDVIDF